MAENVLTKKLGPQPRWAWFAEAAGAYLLFRYIRARQAASSSGLTNTTASAIPLSGGTTVPTDVGGPTTTGPTYSTFADWVNAALGAVTGPGYGATQAYNDITAWINGNCVSAPGFTNLGNFIATNGLPPGFGSSLPTLSVCTSTPPVTGSGGGTTPPASAPTTQNTNPIGATSDAVYNTVTQAMGNGAPSLAQAGFGSLVGNVTSVFKQGNGWTYVTDRGYVYNTNGSTYFGGTNDGAIGGGAAAKIASAFPTQDGGYTLVNNAGQTYHFGPQANAASGQYATASTQPTAA